MIKLFLFLLMTVFLISCNTAPTKLPNETSIDCASSFIHALFKGNFSEAKTIMVNSNADNDCLQKKKFQYKQLLAKELKEQYQRASLVIQLDRAITETEHIYRFIDPITKQNAPLLKVVKKDNEWLVDYAYSCSGNF